MRKTEWDDLRARIEAGDDPTPVELLEHAVTGDVPSDLQSYVRGRLLPLVQKRPRGRPPETPEEKEWRWKRTLTLRNTVARVEFWSDALGEPITLTEARQRVAKALGITPARFRNLLRDGLKDAPPEYTTGIRLFRSDPLPPRKRKKGDQAGGRRPKGEHKKRVNKSDS